MGHEIRFVQSGYKSTMPLFSNIDLIALFWFLGAWIGYSAFIEMNAAGPAGLNALMHRYRSQWMARMLAREPA